MSLFSYFKKRGKAATREAAVARGIRVEDVERDLPIFASRSLFASSNQNRFLRTEVWPCVKYSLRRRPGSEPTNWQFLQRTTKTGAQYPNGWLFEAQHTPSATLHNALQKIATEWDGEQLELEGNKSEVSAYWQEWGGQELVEIIHKYLSALAEA